MPCLRNKQPFTTEKIIKNEGLISSRAGICILLEERATGVAKRARTGIESGRRKSYEASSHHTEQWSSTPSDGKQGVKGATQKPAQTWQALNILSGSSAPNKPQHQALKTLPQNLCEASKATQGSQPSSHASSGRISEMCKIVELLTSSGGGKKKTMSRWHVK